MPVYDLSASDFNSSNDWCNGEDIGGIVVPLEKHLKTGITLPDTGVGILTSDATLSGYAGCAYGEQSQTVAQIMRDATIGITKALAKQAAQAIYGNFLTSAVLTGNILTGSTLTSWAGWGAVVAKTAATIDPTDAVMVLNAETFYKDFLPCLPSNVIYNAQDPIQEGVIYNALGLKAITFSPYLPVKGAIVASDAFGIVNRVNRPVINTYWDTFDVTTEDGLTIGFRAFEHQCQGALKFGGDILFGSKFLQLDENGKAKGVYIIQS